jgi:hypothetical protein
MAIHTGSLPVAVMEVFSQPSPVRNRVNEDAWVFIESPGYPDLLSFAVIDGAGVRKSLPEIGEKVRRQFPNLTPAAFASHLLKRSLEQQLRDNPAHPLRTVLLQANDLLRAEITQIVGTFDARQIVQKLGAPFASDPRNVRLVLPTCVVTLARLDLTHARLEFAHLGDTGLFEMFYDGDVVRHTRDQMRPFDLQALISVLTLQQSRQIEHFENAVSSPEGREFIIQSGLRLNYVDDFGNTDPQQGCGAMNGLPQMEDYIETGTVELDGSRTAGLFLLSDGLELLSPLHEDPVQQHQRYRKIGQLVRQFGLRGLYNEMAQMTAADAHLDTYPRTKLQDDATGIYLGFGRVRE